MTENKIFEALKHLLPEEQVKDISEAVTAMLDESKRDLETEYTQKLEGAYAQLNKELADAEKVAEQGYAEAWGIITDLRNRLEKQHVEFEKAMEEGYEEAYQMLLSERAKNDTLAGELYEAYDKRLSDMKEYIVDKVDEFLKVEGGAIYEQARRDVLNDPRLAEHKVVLEKILDIAADYLSDEDYAMATSSKLEESQRAVEQMRAQIKVLEGRNVKLSTENTKLVNEARIAHEVLTEAREANLKKDRKARVEKGKDSQGRGKLVMEGIIPEAKQDAPQAQAEKDEFNHWKVLSGLKSIS